MSSRGYAGVSWSKGSVAKRAVLSDLRSPVRRAANLPPRARRANSSLSSFVTVFVISSAPRTSHLSHRPSSFHEKLSFQGDEYEGDTSPRFELPTSRFGGRRVDRIIPIPRSNYLGVGSRDSRVPISIYNRGNEKTR